jgi:hypothetical protein
MGAVLNRYGAKHDLYVKKRMNRSAAELSPGKRVLGY